MIEAGQYFGKYRLIQRIATGGMAEIFQAAVTGADGTERLVVIKRLHKHMSEDVELVRMLADEARISVLLDHPNIAQVFDLGVISGQHFIVMAFIDGMDCHDILAAMKARREFLPIPAAIHIISETCRALNYAHSLTGPDGQPLGIVHRDVSPQNIMVGFDGVVRLVDFGIAKARLRAQTTQAGVIKGKFYYMAPEQAHGHHVDGRTDVFSAGMVLYEMLAAQSPYEDVPDTELLLAVRGANFPPLSTFRRDLDPRLEKIVMTALQRDPNLRFPNADIFRSALEDYAQYTYPPVNHREQMAHFVNNVAGRRPLEPSPRMDRKQFLASDGSMIFARPSDDVLRGLPGAQIPGQDMFQSTRGDLPSHRVSSAGMQPRQGLSGGFDSIPVPASMQQNVAPLPAARLPAPPADKRPFESGERPKVVSSATASATNIAHTLSSPKFIGVAAILVLVLAGLTALHFLGSDTDESPVAAEPAAAVVDATPQPLSLAVNTIPANAMVKVDGEERGTTPVSIELTTGKTYRIELIRHGFKPHIQDLPVTVGIEPIEIMMEEVQGVLKVASYPSNALVRLDNREVGPTPLNHTGLVPDKVYLLEATLDGKKLSREVQWKKGDDSVIDVLFEFEKGMPTPILTVADEAPSGLKRPTSTARKTSTQRTPRREPPVKDDGLSLWGSSEKKETKKEEPEEVENLSLFGGSKKKTTKKKSEPAEPAKTEKTEKLKLF